MMKKNTIFKSKYSFITILTFYFLSLVLNNSIPYFTMPTLGQALWAVGYAQSIAQGSFGNLYANDFGYPHPAAIAFGLSAVLPMSWLIKLGLEPIDTYSIIFGFWFGVSFYGAYSIVRYLKLSVTYASALAFSWLIMPVILQHSGYSMLSLGIALLPFYISSAIKLYTSENILNRNYICASLAFFLACIISIFMDGYTFVMFSVAASAFFISYYFISGEKTKYILFKAPILTLSLAISYVFYSLFIGKASYGVEPMEFFRGWGVDILFFLIPSKNISFLFDFLHLSVGRSYTRYFGDTSVWMTTFSLPLLILGAWSVFTSKNNNKLLWVVIVIACFSLYMSLGPSLKIHSVKPENYSQISTLPNTMLMPENLALIPTGSSIISKNLPGFNAMRASYRWAALGIFSLWLLIVIGMSNIRNQKAKIFILFVMIISYFPNVRTVLINGVANLKSAYEINDTIVKDLKKSVPQNQVVAFIPWNNDFFANYLAPASGFKTFNIGGDKNLDEAREFWPSIMNSLQGDIDKDDVPYITQLIINRRVDEIIIPYVNMLWSPHYWLCPEITLFPLSKETRINMRKDLGFVCPNERKQQLSPVINDLKLNPFLAVKDGNYFSTVTLDQNSFEQYLTAHSANIYPLAINSESYYLLTIAPKGWYYLEDGHVWSKPSAILELPVYSHNERAMSNFNIKFNTFNASKNKPIIVEFSSNVNGKTWRNSIMVSSDDNVLATIPIDHTSSKQHVEINVKGAVSPQSLGLSSDKRILGISLQSINID